MIAVMKNICKGERIIYSNLKLYENVNMTAVIKNICKGERII